jgi:methylenetetrahydrofolate dehydrogenase (NADP+)/methenyltetrahydrofolate cyclohydrolase
MIIDGKKIASEILSATRARIAGHTPTPVVRAITVAPNAATESYLRIKSARAEEAGMHLEVVRLPDGSASEDVIAAVGKEGADAIIVQLPLPASIDSQQVLDAIPLSKDADVLSRAARAAFTQHEPGTLLPPVVAAVEAILARAQIEVEGKKAVVIGRGWLVGDPVASWLTHAGAKVTVLTRESADVATALLDADIIVSGAGVAHLIKPDMVKQGVVLVDAGTSESSGTLAGDADPSCADIASVFTPVPGGVGPIAVAKLFENVGMLLTRGEA